MTTWMAEKIWRHNRALVAAGLLSVVALSWAYLWSGAGTMEAMGDMLMPMRTGPWTLSQAIVMLVMWAVMMAAMMLPGAAPMILFYAMIARRRAAAHQPASLSALFAAGYVAVWAAFSVGAVGLQFGLDKAALMSPMMELTSIGLAGAVMIAAGLYQWSPLKRACLRRCSSPLDFVLTHWRDGAGGAFVMGIEHGAYCVGCCWMLMLLLFVGGLMNLAWMAGLALFVLVEKMVPAGHWIDRGAGLVLMTWGLVTLLMGL